MTRPVENMVGRQPTIGCIQHDCSDCRTQTGQPIETLLDEEAAFESYWERRKNESWSRTLLPEEVGMPCRPAWLESFKPYAKLAWMERAFLQPNASLTGARLYARPLE